MSSRQRHIPAQSLLKIPTAATVTLLAAAHDRGMGSCGNGHLSKVGMSTSGDTRQCVLSDTASNL